MSVGIRPLKVCFLGDSNTRGVDFGTSISTTGGFRKPVWDARKGDFVVDLVGTVTDNLTSLDDAHEGWNGYGIGGTSGGSFRLTDKVGNLTTVAADIVCVMAGTNDLLAAWSTSGIRASMLTRLAELLDAIHTERPSAKVLVGSIPPMGTADVGLQSDRTTYNSGIPGVVSTRASWATYVNTANGLTAGTHLQDGVHLNDLGHALVAETWLTAMATAIAGFTATALEDGNDYTFQGNVEGRTGYDAYLARLATKLGRTAPALTSVAESNPLPASIERGNWVVQCDNGRGCEAVFLDSLLMFCSVCWNSSVGNRWRPVSMPDTATRSEIERLLGYRTVDQRWWTTESIATLQAENTSLGLST